MPRFNTLPSGMTGPYTDHHVHLLSTAAARLSIDVSAARSILDLERIVRAGANADGRGWLRAWGYEEWLLAEQRHPSRGELDRMARGRPLVLHHRSGHAAVLSSAALAEIGQADHPDGLLFDRHDLLDRVPPLDRQALAVAAGALSREWWTRGVAAVVDATHTNGPGELEILAGWCSKGLIRQEVTAMVSLEHLGSLPPYRGSVGPIGVGPVKLMPPPSRPGDLSLSVAAAHGAGFPVAVHVVDIDVLDAALGAFERSAPPAGSADRIEHNALCLPEQVDRISASGATVVVNPGFLLHRRRKYEAQVAEVERRWLVRIGSLLRAGVVVRAGSDSPVTPCRPEEILRVAMAHPFSEGESVTRAEAEAMLAPEPGGFRPERRPSG